MLYYVRKDTTFAIGSPNKVSLTIKPFGVVSCCSLSIVLEVVVVVLVIVVDMAVVVVVVVVFVVSTVLFVVSCSVASSCVCCSCPKLFVFSNGE